MLWGISEQYSTLLDWYWVGNCPFLIIVSTVINCMVTLVMIFVAFVDVIIRCLIKLRLYNGYMESDVILTEFCNLQDYTGDMLKEFESGVNVSYD